MAMGSAIVAGIGLTASVVGGAKKYGDQKDAQAAAEEQAQADLIEAQKQDAYNREQTAINNKEASKEKVAYGIQDDSKADTYNDFLVKSPTATTAKTTGGISSQGLGFA